MVTSALGRIEVDQHIGRTATPEGPHTHLLPDLLAAGRTHDPEVPVPADHLPCLFFYPANPLCDLLGRPRPFDFQAHDRFQALLARWGDPAYLAAKARIRQALAAGAAPGSFQPMAADKDHGAVTITLRQALHEDLDPDLLAAWRDHSSAAAND